MKTRLQRLLAGEIEPGVYRMVAPTPFERIAAQAGAAGWHAARLDGQRITTKGEFLDACAAAFRFPGYFGHNWDALEDSLRDLSWTPAGNGRLLVYDGAGAFAGQQPDDFGVALEVLRSAVRFWYGTPAPLAVLVRGQGAALSALPRL